MVRGQRQVELTIADHPTVIVKPIGLVLKAGSWHLVVCGRREAEVMCIDESRATRLTAQRFIPLRDFDLATFWKQHTA